MRLATNISFNFLNCVITTTTTTTTLQLIVNSHTRFCLVSSSAELLITMPAFAKYNSISFICCKQFNYGWLMAKERICVQNKGAICVQSSSVCGSHAIFCWKYGAFVVWEWDWKRSLCSHQNIYWLLDKRVAFAFVVVSILSGICHGRRCVRFVLCRI